MTTGDDRGGFAPFRWARCVGRFYADGFRGMTLGRTLWVVILVKVVVIFGVLKLLFFRDPLDARCDDDGEKSELVLERLSAPFAPDASSHEGEDE